MKEYVCVQVGHHKEIGKAIEEYEREGWSLHTYQATGPYMGEINHYLLFEREKGKKIPSSVKAAAAAAAATT
ncbi:MAG: hypothetical protein OEX77_12035 [Candidatus Bathyarchaeota archaeon]|nr:hypothetical protein [Candidatus Bathyarchaeota archaeon]